MAENRVPFSIQCEKIKKGIDINGGKRSLMDRFLSTVGDEIALSEIIKDIIDDKTKYARMSRTSKERAQRYDISLLIREYSDAYKQICNETFYC